MNKLAVLALALVSTTAMAQDRVAKFDKNNDARVDYAELTETCHVSKTLFDKADKNQDGFLSNSEMRTARGYLFGRCEKLA